MKFRTHRHFLSHISYFVSYLDYLGGVGLGLSRVVQAPDAEKAKEIAKRGDEPIFMGEENKNKLWGFARPG
jgi:hypothetical protein